VGESKRFGVRKSEVGDEDLTGDLQLGRIAGETELIELGKSDTLLSALCFCIDFDSAEKPLLSENSGHQK